MLGQGSPPPRQPVYEAIQAVSKTAAATPGEPTCLLMVFSDELPSTTSRPEDAAEPEEASPGSPAGGKNLGKVQGGTRSVVF